MKRLLIMLLPVFFSSSALAVCTQAGGTSTTAFHLNQVQTRALYVWLANTSQKTVDTTIKVYNSSGVDVTPHVVTTAITQSIPAKGSTSYYMIGKSGYAGTFHAEVTWTSNDCVETPLLGSMETLGLGGTSDSRMGVTMINAGEEF